MAAKCPLFHNAKVLCRIKPESGHKWAGADRSLYLYNYCESNYYTDCEDFSAYLEQQAIVKGKILVVDDEQALVDTLNSYFATRGYETMTATSAEQALELLKTDQPALALVDIKLPGLNGLELVKILKRDYPGIKVFVATGFDEEHKEAAKALGVDAFFAKPLALDELRNEVVRVLAPTERRLQQALEGIQPIEGTPQAKLLFVLEALPNEDNRFARYLQEQFGNQAECEGNYQMEFAYS
ncbi:MAG: response regulator, partial [Candidatus Omnitrophica bacterium]|nr:response regulator [Candidatus Omnitrophota bacterium]